MMSSDGNVTKATNFGAIFGLKKRINGTKETPTIIEDLKCPSVNGCGANIGTGNRSSAKYTGGMQYSNGCIDYTSPVIDVGEKLNQLNINNEQQFRCRGSPLKSAKRDIRNGKTIKPVKAPRSGSVPLHISALVDGTGSNKAQNVRRDHQVETLNGRRLQEKSRSINAMFEVQNDPSYLTEALESIAAEQPIVARSIPKHAVVDTTDYAKHSLDNCLFDEAVYDAMLEDSLKTCQLLQDHLNDCANYVRARTPTNHEAAQRSNREVAGKLLLDSDEHNVRTESFAAAAAAASLQSR